MRKHDVIFLLIIGLLASSIFLFQRFIIPNSEDGTVVVERDGVICERYSLYENATYRLSDSFGCNVLVIQNKEAYISEADCPDGICMKQGAISKNGQSIICLPHHLVIRIVGGKEAELDGITGS